MDVHQEDQTIEVKPTANLKEVCLKLKLSGMQLLGNEIVVDECMS